MGWKPRRAGSTAPRELAACGHAFRRHVHHCRAWSDDEQSMGEDYRPWYPRQCQRDAIGQDGGVDPIGIRDSVESIGETRSSATPDLRQRSWLDPGTLAFWTRCQDGGASSKSPSRHSPSCWIRWVTATRRSRRRCRYVIGKAELGTSLQQLISKRLTLSAMQPSRPCYPRATSDGHVRCRADNHGHCRSAAELATSTPTSMNVSLGQS